MDLLVAAIAVFLAMAVKGVTGFGSALIAMPVFLWLWGPVDAVLVMASLDVVAGIALLPSAWRNFDGRLVAAAMVPLSLGQVAGTGLLTVLPPAAATAVLGVVVLVFAVATLHRPVRGGWGGHEGLSAPRGRSAAIGVVAAGLAGLLTGWVGAGGPPLVMVARRWFTDRYGRAQLIGIFWGAAVTLLALLAVRGVDPGRALAVTPWLLAPLALGSWIGSRLAPRLSPVHFGRMVGGVLLVSGLVLLASVGRAP